MHKNEKITPMTYDSVFKSVLQSKEVEDYLADILSNIINIKKEYIKGNIIFKNSELLKSEERQKGKRTDLLIELDNHIINLEMNKSYYDGLYDKNEDIKTVVNGSKEMKIVAKKISKISREEEMEGIYDYEEQQEYIKQRIKAYARTKGYDEGFSIGEKQGIEQGIEKGIEQGIEQEKKLFVTNLLKQGVDINIISKSSGLSKEEILKIKKEM